MHNGGIAEFNTKIKRRLQGILSDELFNVPQVRSRPRGATRCEELTLAQGNTDSEWVWALFLQHLSKRSNIHGATFSHAHLREAMLETIAQLNAWAKEADVEEPSLLNFAVTDGRSVVATRYVSSVVDEAASLVRLYMLLRRGSLMNRGTVFQHRVRMPEYLLSEASTERVTAPPSVRRRQAAASTACERCAAVFQLND